MTLRTRRIFFWSLIPAFVVGGAFAVSYSQGYRVDLSTREVTKVGAFYVRGYPRSAQITLDGESLNTGSWWPLQSGTLANSLVPGTYRLHGEAPGYQPWDADIIVRPTLVTERKSLILFPASTEQISLPDETTSPDVLAIADDGEELIVGDTTEGVTYVGVTRVVGTYLGNAGGRAVTAAEARSGKVTSLILRFQAADEASATTASYKGSVIGVMDDSVAIRESERLVSAYDAGTGARTVLASTTEGTAIGSVLRTDSYDAWEEASETSSTLVIRRRGSTARVQVPIEGIISIDPAGSQIGVRDAAGSLWLIDPSNGTRREVAHRATFASWRPDGAAVAAVIDGTLEVIALKQDAPHGKLYTILERGIMPQAITWYPDGEHLFVELKNSLLFVDIIDGTPEEQHFYRVPLTGSWAFSDETRTLYLSADNAVQAYVFPD